MVTTEPDAPLVNRLLNGLPADVRENLVAQMELVSLEASQLLYLPNRPIEDVYFPLNLVCSLLVVLKDGTAVEVGTVGNEGVVGLPLFLGAWSTPGQAMVQIRGQALRMAADTFVRTVLELDGPLYRALQRYTQALFVQTTQGTACNQSHSLVQRCCRWLLLTHDRVGQDCFVLADRFLAQMLGTGRGAARAVAAELELAGLITYQGDELTIRDYAGLERSSCECYSVIRTTYEQLLP